MEQAVRTSRTASTARPVTSSSGRFVRLGTVSQGSSAFHGIVIMIINITALHSSLLQASMLSSADGPFVNVSRLNLNKYAANQALARPLFEYLFYHDGDVRTALQLAALATQAVNFQDWWWKVQLGKCYHR